MSSADYIAAVRAQRQAADPSSTRLASANAGSGKTRVLVNRVSRILLGGTKPEKILCLTYTKAAASEMQSRLFETLGKWSIETEDNLKAELDNLLGDNHGFTDLPRARRLFAEALETPEGLKVQTIHAFCERILSRFPIEAGILPGFEPIDDGEYRQIREAVRDDLYRQALSEPQGALNTSLQTLTAEKADQTLETLFNWMAGAPDKIRQWNAAGGIALLAEILDIDDPAKSIAEIKAEGWERAPKNRIFRAATEMLGSTSKGDVSRAERMLASFDIEDPFRAFEHYSAVFLTANESGPLKTVVTQQSGDFAQLFFSNIEDGHGSERERVLRIVEHIKSTTCLKFTKAAFTVAKDYANRFEKMKRARRGLDFNDQILLVRDLLSRSEVSDWISYKLDGGIEHLLLDEAQDTSPEQWQIIDALADGFTQDSPDRDPRKPRTLFAVGDEKQSIYSFQGADPEKFIEKTRTYSGADNPGEIRMRMSFRSAPEILKFVDQVFVENHALQRMFNVQNYVPASDLISHTANRSDTGQVDFWPLAPKAEVGDEKQPWDTTPVDALSKADSREQLAEAIARRIKDWLDKGEPVFDRKLGYTRPLQAGDILILVRQRNAFFDAVIRNLKGHSVPVAGADRLKLKDSIAVKDLLSLAKFTLLPDDDLSLAEILKSPLLGFDDKALFDVAAQRGDISLWASVQAKRPDTAQLLQAMIDYSRRFAPYEFFARVLDMVDDTGRSLTYKLYARLGLEAKDAIEAFLARALAHQRQVSPSLQHFVLEFSRDEQELKREMDSGAGQVRVMTVHGAKGLEAPIVFLPDTTQSPSKGPDVIPIDSGFALTPNAKAVPAALEPYKEAVKSRMGEEYLRLFYVAMTRAESRLVICGYHSGSSKTGMSKHCWYQEAQEAFAGLSPQILETPFGDGLSFGAGAKAPRAAAESDTRDETTLPIWVCGPAKSETSALRRVTPSYLLAPPGSNMPVRSPLAGAQEARFMRGNLIHKLLEILPEFDPPKRKTMAAKMVSGYKMIPEVQRRQIIGEVFAVLDNPDFAEVFAPGSRAEISLAGRAKTLPPHLYLNAQIDRISVTDTKAFIVDYKSNRPPPQTQDGVADIYWGQMAAYRALAREIYPDKEVICALLWTDGPRLMILDDKRLDAALTRIAALPT